MIFKTCHLTPSRCSKSVRQYPTLKPLKRVGNLLVVRVLLNSKSIISIIVNYRIPVREDNVDFDQAA